MQSEKVRDWFSGHSKFLLEPYYFGDQTAGGADCNHLLHTYFRSQAPNFPSDELFQQDEDSPDTNRQLLLFLMRFAPIVRLEIISHKMIP